MANQELIKIKEFIDEFSQTNLTTSEANTKKKIIEPLLERLGWDFRSAEVRLEHPVSIGTGTSYVDYALNLEGKTVVFVEAKPFDSNLDEGYSKQIISYGRVDDVRWAAVTNGKAMKLFDTTMGKEEKDCLIGEIDLRNLPENKDLLLLLHRDSIVSGEIESMAERLRDTKAAIKRLKQRQSELQEKICEAIISISGLKIKNRVDQISEILSRRTIELLEGQVEIEKEPVYMPKPIGDSEIIRAKLSHLSQGDVILCPSKPDGIEFLKKYNAWGFVRVSRKPKYFALYVGRPVSSILYFAEIEQITDPIRTREEISMILDQDMDTFTKGKQVIWLKPNSLKKLLDPIPLINKQKGLQGPKYTSLDKFLNAKRMEEL